MSTTQQNSTVINTQGNRELFFADAQVSEADRLGFTFIIAIAIHGLLIFGVGFSAMDPKTPAKLLEVTLSQFKNDDPPKSADFLAQHNQQGSGTLEQRAQLSTTEQSIYQDNVVKHIQLKKPTVLKTDPLEQQRKISSSAETEFQVYGKKQQPAPDFSKFSPAEIQQLEQQNLEIASLQAKLNEKKQVHAKGPKTRQITSVSAKSSDDAAYINSFREKIEYIGNKYYPQEAKEKGMHGNVQLLVAIRKDGSIQEIRVLQSSNNPLLDKAAINSVRLAAPFPRFPKSMRENTDVLEIIRTWQFEHQGVSTHS